MKKNYLLGGLLVLQALAAYFVLSGDGELQGHAGIQKLLEFNREQVDGIWIEGNEGNLAELKREDDAWLTAEDFPVNTDRVDRLLDRLDELEHGLAVASSSSAAKRFEVSRDSFQRHLKLLKDGKPVAEFYLGTGAGARRNHVRLADQEMIYAATIGSYDLPAEVADWQDKDLLQIEMDAIQSVELEDLTIRRAEQSENDSESEDAELDADAPEWLADDLAEDETFKADEFESQLRNLATLRYNRAFKGSFGGRVVEAEIAVHYGDKSRTYQFAKAKVGGNFWLKVSDHEAFFEVTQFNGNRIVDNLTREKVIEKAEPEEGSEEADEGVENNSEADGDLPEASPIKE
jgi:hypothetical protein